MDGNTQKQMLKQQIKRLKLMLKTTQDLDLLHKSLDIIYERISNNTDKDYSKQYSITDIFLGKTIKTIKKYRKGTGVVFEISQYEKAPNGFVIIYNQFNNFEQTKIDMYVIK